MDPEFFAWYYRPGVGIYPNHETMTTHTAVVHMGDRAEGEDVSLTTIHMLEMTNSLWFS